MTANSVFDDIDHWVWVDVRANTLDIVKYSRVFTEVTERVCEAWNLVRAQLNEK